MTRLLAGIKKILPTTLAALSIFTGLHAGGLKPPVSHQQRPLISFAARPPQSFQNPLQEFIGYVVKKHPELAEDPLGLSAALARESKNPQVKKKFPAGTAIAGFYSKLKPEEQGRFIAHYSNGQVKALDLRDLSKMYRFGIDFSSYGGIIHLLEKPAQEEYKKDYLPNMISGVGMGFSLSPLTAPAVLQVIRNKGLKGAFNSFLRNDPRAEQMRTQYEYLKRKNKEIRENARKANKPFPSTGFLPVFPVDKNGSTRPLKVETALSDNFIGGSLVPLLTPELPLSLEVRRAWPHRENILWLMRTRYNPIAIESLLRDVENFRKTGKLPPQDFRRITSPNTVTLKPKELRRRTRRF